MSDRNCQQRVDLTAVENDCLADEFPASGLAFNLIDIAASAKYHHLAMLHRAHDEEIRCHIERSRPVRRIADDLD